MSEKTKGEDYTCDRGHGMAKKDEGYEGENIKDLVSEHHWFGPCFHMVFLALLGASAMVLHHFLNSYFDGKRVLEDVVFFWRIPITRQILMGVTGNAIAAAGSITLSAATGIAAVQVLWSSLGQRSHSIRQIRAILECRTQPFAPIAWPAWSSSRRLVLLAVFGSLMTLITIFAPSSLRSAAGLSKSVPCTVKRVDLNSEGYNRLFVDQYDHLPTDVISNTTSLQLRKLVARNIMDGMYLTPPNPCNQSCSYTFHFNAPAMNCSDNPKYDFNEMKTHSNLSQLVIWNGTHDIDFQGSTIQVATMGGLTSSVWKACTCKVYNATYFVDVLHNNTVTTVDVKEIVRQQKISTSNSSAPDYQAIYNTALSLAQLLQGIIFIDVFAMAQIINAGISESDNIHILYSALGGPNPSASANSVPWLWDPDMPAILSELATNISISLLSNPLGMPMIDVQTTCQYLDFVYVYNPFHLFLTYGIGLVTATFCLLMGLISVYNNKREETLHFSRLLVAILDPKLSEEVLTDETKLIAESRISGKSATYSQFKKVY